MLLTIVSINGLSLFIIFFFKDLGNPAPCVVYITCHIVYSQGWGGLKDANNTQVVDFIEQLEKFVKNLEGARGNMEGQVTLSECDLGWMLDGMSPSEYNTTGM